MATRKINELYWPKHFHLMLDRGAWWMYNTDLQCPEERVDRRLALRLIRENFAVDKWIDPMGRIFYKRNENLSDFLGPISQ